MAVDDEAGGDRIGRQERPDEIGMAWKHLRASVPKMGGQRRAGGYRVLDLLRRSASVPDRDSHAGFDEVIDQRQRT